MSGLTRRQLLKIGMFSGFSFGVGVSVNTFAQIPRQANPAFDPDVEIQLTAAPQIVSLLDDRSTNVWSYQGKLLKGDTSNLIASGDSYLGPTIRVRQGQKVRIHFTNQIEDPSIIHWHGLHVPEEADGHPRYVINQGETYVYEFEVKNRAGTYWYHPHPHGITGRQVYFGLAGLFLVEDEEEQALSLPAGEFDVSLIIQDRRITNEGSLRYIAPGMQGHMDWMQGFLGDTILVNGLPDYRVSVKTGVYRVRLLNGSNSRIYKLYLNDGSPFTVIGTDGGLLESPVSRPYLVLAPAERVELLLDFSRYSTGTTVQLRSMPFDSGEMGMMGQGRGMGMMGRGRGSMMGGLQMVNGGNDFNILDFNVVQEIQNSYSIPQKLTAFESLSLNDAINAENPRQFAFQMQMMNVAINGRTFEVNQVAPDEIVNLNTSEIWEFINAGPMPMPHPAHIHGLQFRIIERKGTPADMQAGYVDSGWKDSLLLMPGERARLLLKFEDFAGTYLYHCHNLEHEDLGMMRNYQIKP